MDTPRSRKRRRGKSPPLGEKALQYFGEKIEKNGNEMYPCRKCGRQINGNRLYNLASHLSSCQYEVYKEIYKMKKNPIQIRRLILLQNAVQIVTVDGKPFEFLRASGYQAGIENKLEKLKNAGYPLDLKHRNQPDVKDHLHKMAEKARDKIRECVRSRDVCVLIDIVTKNGRSIVGISVQFSIDGNLKIFSLGLIELERAHTGTYLASVCIECLQKYEISIKKVITITRDNGANVDKMVRDIHNDLQNSMAKDRSEKDLNFSTNDDSTTESEETDNCIAQLLAEADDITDENALANLFENALHDEHESILNDISTEMQNNGFDIQWDITGINCAVHTLQLAVNDALKLIANEHKNVIELCRRTAKLLRLPKAAQQMKDAGIEYKRPRLDCITRWGSMYQMVKRLIVRFHELICV